MSVSSRILVGLTIELAHDLTAADFKKIHRLEEKYPELDEYSYNPEEREGQLLLIYDGMNGQFARLIMIDKLIEGGSLGEANEFFELAAPGHVFNKELVSKMADLYEEYTDTRPALTDYRYAMWSMWM